MVALPLGFQEDILFRRTFSMAMTTRAAKVCKRLTIRSGNKLATSRASAIKNKTSASRSLTSCVMPATAGNTAPRAEV